MEEETNKKAVYEKWWFWLILVILIIVILFIRFNKEPKKESNNNNTNNEYAEAVNYINESKQNYNDNVKLKENIYEATNELDGIYKFVLNSDNGNGHIFSGVGIILFDKGRCKVKYEFSSESTSGVMREYNGFCGINKNDNNEFYFSLNDDGNYEVLTYKCTPNEKNLSCELKTAYDLVGCTNKNLELIYQEDQSIDELDTILQNTIKEEEERKIAEEKAKKEEEETDFKANCKTYTFEQIARNPDNFKGTNVKLTGEVIQTLYGTASVDLRINITKEGKYSTYYTDTIYAVYYPEEGEDKILEGDIVTIYGISEGDYTYTSTIGSQITLPLIEIKYIELNENT